MSKLDEAKQNINYNKLTDEELIDLIHNGESTALDYLIYKYQPFVNAKIRSYYMIGAEREDLLQEGMIGLFKAIKNFNKDKTTIFKSFAELCIKRHIITVIKTTTRQKHTPLNSYISLDKSIYTEDSNTTLMDIIINSKVLDPEEACINKEASLDLLVKISGLFSPLERQVLPLYLEGNSYQEISSKLGRSIKAVDNSITRIKRKLERYTEVMKTHLIEK
ncbi:RNA polymerase sporulation sigma factor SigH [Gracilibacillus massiliensis]|uniref:RNA polymerase sporulation sigma factor SigH n=1 Tax=Gracilibacillus massiliensis TaxID=1564956 RepID=UPI00071D4532|nr:RNA polymerase sporulation sigma factor SigH [Gracilibacillus massiliensis]